MSLLVRVALRSRVTSYHHTCKVLCQKPPIYAITRGYAKSHRKGGSYVSSPTPEAVDTHTDFTPPRGSKKHKKEHEDISDTALSEEDQIVTQASHKMDTTVEWYKRELAQMESRVSGRVVPSLLDPVRVKTKSTGDVAVRLDQVATVGLRDGNVLIITLFDEENMKDVEKAVVDAQIPNMNPQRGDARTLRITVPKPTMEARQSVVTSASKLAEETKVKIRISREHGMKELKKLGYDKHSKFAEEIQKATDKHVKGTDEVLAKLKKTIAS